MPVKSRKLRIGLIGTGGICRAVHIPGWKDNPDVEIVAACDIVPGRVQAVALEHNIPHVFTDHRKLVKMKEIDAVDVCTPSRAHTPVVLSALQAGKHVLCEKPLATSPAEIERMIRAANKARRMLMVGQNQRFRGISQAIRRWVDAGHLGRPYFARSWAIRRNLLPPSTNFTLRKNSGGGCCMDIGVHCLDATMWLMDFPEPEFVMGTASHQLAKLQSIPGGWGQWDPEQFDVEDFACGLVRFKSGAMLALEASWLGHMTEREVISCTIFGDKAGVTWPEGDVATAENGVLVDSRIKPLPIDEASHTVEIREFYRAIIEGRPSPVPAEQALKVIRILDGVYRSQKRGREVRV